MKRHIVIVDNRGVDQVLHNGPEETIIYDLDSYREDKNQREFEEMIKESIDEPFPTLKDIDQHWNPA